MILACSHCKKKLKVPDTSAGKKMRCPHCKGVITVPAPAEEEVADAAPPPIEEDKPKPKAPAVAHHDEPEEEEAPKKKPSRWDDDDDEVPAPRKSSKRPARDEDDEEDDEPPAPKKSPKRPARDEDEDEIETDDEDDDADPDALRCAKCNSPAIEKLPPNVFSRNPGFGCRKCGAMMRPPGSTGVYLFAMLMGSLVLFFGLALAVGIVVLIFTSDEAPLKGFGGAGVLALFGLVVAIWGFQQIRLPVPRNAPPFRWGLWLVIALVGLVAGSLLIGGCLFGVVYVFQEIIGIRLL